MSCTSYRFTFIIAEINIASMYSGNHVSKCSKHFVGQITSLNRYTVKGSFALDNPMLICGFPRVNLLISCEPPVDHYSASAGRTYSIAGLCFNGCLHSSRAKTATGLQLSSCSTLRPNKTFRGYSPSLRTNLQTNADESTPT